jgi:predicted enzyme related to lactoylglutathione lyase
MTFSGITFTVGDVRFTASFYRQVFGLLPKPSGDVESTSASLSSGETTLSFESPEDADARRDVVIESVTQGGLSTTRLEFTVDDLAGTYLRALSCGAAPVSEPAENGVDRWTATVRDPDGMLIDLQSPPSW